VSNDGNISDNLQDLLESSRRTHRRLFAAGRIAGLREAAEVVAKAASVEEDLARSFTGTEAAYEYAAAAGALNDARADILALAERGEG
jgi:hypothetical protein